jgi:hypothetical protein
MLKEAQARRNDADILARSLSSQSDSQAFLRVLAFEILLKAALLASGANRASGHKYQELWSQLPADVERKIMAVALDRMPGHADLSNVAKLLVWYQFIFEKARYSYELYDAYTDDEVRELAKSWIDRGAPVEEAVIQYYPSELECLTEGLAKYVTDAL